MGDLGVVLGVVCNGRCFFGEIIWVEKEIGEGV